MIDKFLAALDRAETLEDIFSYASSAIDCIADELAEQLPPEDN